MKIGDMVVTPSGIGTYVGGRNGRIVVSVPSTRQLALLPQDVTPFDVAKVDAVVGEQCEAILQRLAVVLQVGSVGEVEAAVLALLEAREGV